MHPSSASLRIPTPAWRSQRTSSQTPRDAARVPALAADEQWVPADALLRQEQGVACKCKYEVPQRCPLAHARLATPVRCESRRARIPPPCPRPSSRSASPAAGPARQPSKPRAAPAATSPRAQPWPAHQSRRGVGHPSPLLPPTLTHQNQAALSTEPGRILQREEGPAASRIDRQGPSSSEINTRLSGAVGVFCLAG